MKKLNLSQKTLNKIDSWLDIFTNLLIDLGIIAAAIVVYGKLVGKW